MLLGKRLSSITCSVLAAALFAACSSGKERVNVLFVVVDTLRADKLGCYGGDELTPNLDVLAAQGALFEDASSHAPWTLPSTASIFTGMLPQQHGAGGNLTTGFRGVAKGVETLPGLFRGAGYATGAVVNVAFLDRKFGVTRDFADLDAKWYETNLEVRSARKTTDLAIDWMEAHREKPFFLLVHYFDPHCVYDPPPAYRRKYADARDQGSAEVFGTRKQLIDLRKGKLELHPAVVKRAEKLYDGEIAFTDAQIGRLVETLGRLGLEGRTLVVFTADHGEEFLDHDGFEHGHTLYNELVHVPLILRLPGVIPPRRISGSVRHVDVAPTVCELADVRPGGDFVGQSLVGPMLRDESVEHDVLAFGNFWGPPLTSYRDAEWKLIVDPGKGGVELYRWRDDPGETANLASSEPDARERLERELEEARREAVGRAREGSDVALSEEERRRLGEVGYTGGEDE